MSNTTTSFVAGIVPEGLAINYTNQTMAEMRKNGAIDYLNKIMMEKGLYYYARTGEGVSSYFAAPPVDLGKKSWEATTAHMKSLAGVQSPVDLMKAQTEFARGQFDVLVSDFSKSTEFYMKLAGEIAQPIQNRYAAATEQLKARFAA